MEFFSNICAPMVYGDDKWSKYIILLLPSIFFFGQRLFLENLRECHHNKYYYYYFVSPLTAEADKQRTSLCPESKTAVN